MMVPVDLKGQVLSIAQDKQEQRFVLFLIKLESEPEKRKSDMMY